MLWVWKLESPHAHCLAQGTQLKSGGWPRTGIHFPSSLRVRELAHGSSPGLSCRVERQEAVLRCCGLAGRKRKEGTAPWCLKPSPSDLPAALPGPPPQVCPMGLVLTSACWKFLRLVIKARRTKAPTAGKHFLLSP